MAARQTLQKTIIYAALCELANHPTADMVCERVRRDFPTVSKATVYRVLRQMAEQGKIVRLSVPGGPDHYDHMTHPHFHVCCTGCARVDDVEMPDPGALEKTVTDSRGYRISGCSVVLTGLCPDCQK
ncbi:MAG: Fur family transcriptional regulator [Oscillospiraceae bacterium]